MLIDNVECLGRSGLPDRVKRTGRQRHWSMRLERARYGSTLARWRHEAVGRQNRPVARTLQRSCST